MICVQHSCSECKHIRPNIDGWRCACDAFPNGIPDKYLFDIDVTKLDECANGIKYEINQPKHQSDKLTSIK